MQKNKKVIQQPAKRTPTEKMIIEVYPFTDVSSAEASSVLESIKKVYPAAVLQSSLALPANAFYKPRNRYKADSLINFLTGIVTPGHVCIGLTNKDISTTKDDHPDWGVMGLGQCPGTACVASAFRLDEKNKLEQWFKVAIHELGHTQGLDHCPGRSCLMRDAEGANPTNSETGFCESCKRKLVAKGWRF